MKGILSCLFIVGAAVLLPFFDNTAARSAEANVEQWTRFETSFTSSRDYENPPQAVELKVEFASQNGNKRTLLDFWDGGRKWRVRFSPDVRGKWTYNTICSDEANKGLHNRTGSFQCRGYQGDLALFIRGELRLSDNRRRPSKPPTETTGSC